MDITTVAVVAAALALWSLASARLGRLDVTGPMAMLALGALSHWTGLVELPVDDLPLGEVASVALALLLFGDAARVDVSRLRHDPSIPGRLLGIGLPLTIGAGLLGALGLLPAGGWTGALLIAACLAPTDAGLGSAIVEDERVPRRIRRTLNIESGLNDGIVAPVVTLAIALVLETEVGGTDVVIDAGRALGLGLLAGLAVGAGGGLIARRAAAAGWMSAQVTPIAVLALTVLAYAGAIAIGGNGFIGAFVAGLAFGPSGRVLASPDGPRPLVLTALGGQLVGAVVWFFFGAALLPEVATELSWTLVGYAVLSLTVVRMLPVAVALIGSRLDWPTAAFIGWFGPRGLASLVFALEAVDHLGSEGDLVLGVVGLTVLLSVILHGASASPLAARFGDWAQRQHTDHPSRLPVPEMPTRRHLARWGHRSAS